MRTNWSTGKMKTIISILLVFSFTAHAQKLEVVKKGQKAPYSGLLADKKQMEQFREINEKKKLLEKQNIELKDLALTKDQRIKFHQENADFYKQELRKQESRTFWAKVGYFALGVVVTGIAAKTAIEASR